MLGLGEELRQKVNGHKGAGSQGTEAVTELQAMSLRGEESMAKAPEMRILVGNSFHKVTDDKSSFLYKILLF